MADIRMLPQDQVVRLIADADPREFSLFLGAGASRSSGIMLASEMICEWSELAFRELAGSGQTFESWCAAQDWYQQPHEYSDLFELLYPDERARQKYLEPKMEAAFPSWGYLYLANIIREGHINLVFTTNFDDMVNEAMTRFIGYNAVVCAADSEVASINVATARAKIIKLHGDYLFKSLKNTREELERLTTNMSRKFAEFARQCGMVVIGYAGADESIMSQLGTVLEDATSFPNGIYWGIYDPAARRPEPLERAVQAYPKRLRLFTCQDFDVFMASLHHEYGLAAPMMVVEPLKTARVGIDRLIGQTTPRQAQNATLRSHLELLKQQVGGAIAQAADADAIELFDAEIALGSRNYADALQRVARYVTGHPGDARALTIWGTALMIQSQEEGDRQLAEEAAAKWREAVTRDPAWTGARYNLVRYHFLRLEYREAIAEAEKLIALAPRDAYLRLNLVQLYAGAGRMREALDTADQLLAKDPDNAVLHMMRATVLEQRGRPGDALAALQRAVRIAPANPWFRIQSALGYARAARPQEAASEFLQAIQLEPRNASFRILAATFFLSTNQAPQALMHLREAARLEPDASEVRGWLATAHMAAGAIHDAQREIEAALRIDPNESRLLMTAGQIYMATNQLDRAEQCLQHAVQVNMHAVGAYELLAHLYFRWQRRPQFQAVMQQVSALDPVAALRVQQQLGLGAGPLPIQKHAFDLNAPSGYPPGYDPYSEVLSTRLPATTDEQNAIRTKHLAVEEPTVLPESIDGQQRTLDEPGSARAQNELSKDKAALRLAPGRLGNERHVDGDAPFGHHFLEVPVADAVAAVPANHPENDLAGEVRSIKGQRTWFVTLVKPSKSPIIMFMLGVAFFTLDVWVIGIFEQTYRSHTPTSINILLVVVMVYAIYLIFYPISSGIRKIWRGSAAKDKVPRGREEQDSEP